MDIDSGHLGSFVEAMEGQHQMSKQRATSWSAAIGVLSIAAVSLTGGMAHAGFTSVDSSYFGAGTTVITFSEVPEFTAIPFTIGIADFIGLAGIVTDDDAGGASAPPAPSGGAYLYSGSVGNDDMIEILLGTPQEAVGAYFSILGGGGLLGMLQIELYSGDTLLGSLLASFDAGTSGGFLGASAGSAIIDRVIFRDIDDSIGISFRLDDVQFIPAGGPLALLPFAALARRRRRV